MTCCVADWQERVTKMQTVKSQTVARAEAEAKSENTQGLALVGGGGGMA